MGKVLLIGGSPMIGKSTVARRISSMYELQNFSTDDIGEILQTVVNINPMKDMNYLEYYENVEPDVQISDMLKYHKALENAITKIVSIHSNWGQSMVMEGYAIYPNILMNDNVDAIWLIASEELLADRVNQSQAFEAASGRAKENYLKRSIWHNQFLKEQCKIHNRKYIELCGQETRDDIVECIMRMVNIRF